MLQDAVNVGFEELLPFCRGLCVHIIDICREGYLGVYDHLPLFVQVKNDVRTHYSAALVLDGLSVRAHYYGLRVKVHSLPETLGTQEFFQDGLAPVALHLAAVLECLRQLVGALSRHIAVLQQGLDALAHLCVALALLLVVFFHPLLEFGDVLLERGHNLAESLVAGLGELFLAGLEHLGSLVFDLGAHLGHCLVELFPEGGEGLFVALCIVFLDFFYAGGSLTFYLVYLTTEGVLPFTGVGKVGVKQGFLHLQ